MCRLIYCVCFSSPSCIAHIDILLSFLCGLHNLVDLVGEADLEKEQHEYGLVCVYTSMWGTSGWDRYTCIPHRKSVQLSHTRLSPQTKAGKSLKWSFPCKVWCFNFSLMKSWALRSASCHSFTSSQAKRNGQPWLEVSWQVYIYIYLVVSTTYCILYAICSLQLSWLGDFWL